MVANLNCLENLPLGSWKWECCLGKAMYEYNLMFSNEKGIPEWDQGS